MDRMTGIGREKMRKSSTMCTHISTNHFSIGKQNSGDKAVSQNACTGRQKKTLEKKIHMPCAMDPPSTT